MTVLAAIALAGAAGAGIGLFIRSEPPLTATSFAMVSAAIVAILQQTLS